MTFTLIGGRVHAVVRSRGSVRPAYLDLRPCRSRRRVPRCIYFGLNEATSKLPPVSFVSRGLIASNIVNSTSMDSPRNSKRVVTMLPLMVN